MRTATITLDGQKHLLCYSLQVLRDCAEEWGSLEATFDAVDSVNEVEALDAALWLIVEMMEAGARYAARNGIPNAQPLSRDDLYELADASDFRALKGAILETIANGHERHVETAATEGDEKNGETTQGS